MGLTVMSGEKLCVVESKTRFASHLKSIGYLIIHILEGELK